MIKLWWGIAKGWVLKYAIFVVIGLVIGSFGWGTYVGSSYVEGKVAKERAATALKSLELSEKQRVVDRKATESATKLDGKLEDSDEALVEWRNYVEENPSTKCPVTDLEWVRRFNGI